MRNDNEIKHGSFLSKNDPELLWGWGTPAGKLRAIRRGKLIAENADLNSEKLVLEIGCGSGVFTEIFAKTAATIVAVDISSDLLEIARSKKLAKNVVFKEARFEDCVLDGPFDAIIGSSVLHHLDQEKALYKINSLLKPGGIMSFAEPNCLNPQVFFMFKFRSLFPEISPDENPFVRWNLLSKLKKANFKSIKINPFDWLHPNIGPNYIQTIDRLGKVLESVPIIREFSGSLLITAKK